MARGNVVLVDHGRALTGLCEAVTVPPVPAIAAVCDRPACGCRDTEEGNAPARLDQRPRRTRPAAGRALVPDDVRELFDVVGEAATHRAGLGLESAGQRHEQVVPGTAYAQAAALRTLLAQSVYPGDRAAASARSSAACAGHPGSALPRPRRRRRRAGGPHRRPSRAGSGSGSVELWRSARGSRADGLGERRRSPSSPSSTAWTYWTPRTAPPIRSVRCANSSTAATVAHRQGCAALRSWPPGPARAPCSAGASPGRSPTRWGPAYAAGLAPRGDGAAPDRDRRPRPGPAAGTARRTPAAGDGRRCLGAAPRSARQRPPRPALRRRAGGRRPPGPALRRRPARRRSRPPAPGSNCATGSAAAGPATSAPKPSTTSSCQGAVRGAGSPPCATRCRPPAARSPNPSSRYASWPRSTCAAPGCARSPPRTTPTLAGALPGRAAGGGRAPLDRQRPGGTRRDRRARHRAPRRANCSTRSPKPWRRTGASATTWCRARRAGAARHRPARVRRTRPPARARSSPR